MLTDGYWTCHGDCVGMYMIVGSLCCTLETNNVVCQLYFNKNKKDMMRLCTLSLAPRNCSVSGRSYYY